MRKSIDELYKSNYSVQSLSVLRQYWKKTNTFSCFSQPKKQELFLYLDGCDAVYERADGTKLFAQSGNLVYTATGSEYKVKFINFKGAHSSTVGISFYLFDEENRPISLDQDLIVFNTNEEIASAFEKAVIYADSSTKNIRARFKAILYQILSELGENRRFFALQSEHGYSIISRAIQYIDTNIESNLSIAELAEMCKISEVYLRTLFQKFTGKSPSRYRMDLRLKKAKKYLLYGDIPVNEIGELLGFSSVAYFIKSFKEKYGCSPLEYRKKNKT